MTDSNTGSRATWTGAFDPETYVQAREILEADKQRVYGEVSAEGKRRGRIIIAVAAIWVVCSVALAVANGELLIVAEIGWVAIVAWAVFWMFPTLMGRANLDDLYDQYANQLAKLEEAGIAMPAPSCIEDLVAAIDLVSPAEE